MNKKYIAAVGAMLLVPALLFSCSPTPAPQATPVAMVDETTGGVSVAVPTVTVSGEGRYEIKPDMASMQFGVEAVEKKTAQEAMSAIDEIIGSVAAALQQHSVEEKDIQTSNYYVYESYKYDTKGNITSGPYFNASTTLTVNVYDVDNTGAVIDAAITAGATHTYGITFGVKDETKKASEAEAINAAMDNARSRAQALATAANRTLGDVILINDGTQISEQVYYAQETAMDTAAPNAYAAGSSSSSYRSSAVMPGTTVITANVSVRFTMN
ncbi:SIMPL domain-containing protein [Christensenellaceae bacterium OttesenSCG-928-M15]|nr:SIMPL domain-containing protein [Christensenellaceae bacterium OttesenSCG-928-M15]